MPDPLLILGATVLAAAGSAAILLLLSLPWRALRPNRMKLGWVLGVGAGFFVGCWFLDLLPRWPLREDRDRLLALVVPAVIAIECVGACSKVPRWLAWSLRALIAAGVGRVLLHNSIYLTDLAGPGTRRWTQAQSWLILAAMAALLMVVWAVLATVAKRRDSRSIPLALAMASFASGIAVMLSGYATGGQLALPLGAAITGAAIASLFYPSPPQVDGVIGFSLVTLFGVIVAGRFFAELTTAHGLLLTTAPLWCAATELRYFTRLKEWGKNAACLALIAIPLTLVLVQTQRQFIERSGATQEGPASSNEPALDDYMNFGR